MFKSFWPGMQAGNEQAMKGRGSDKMRPNYDVSAGIREMYVQRLAKSETSSYWTAALPRYFRPQKPVARRIGYNFRGKLIVITLKGGCEFAFPAALAEVLADTPATIAACPTCVGTNPR
jgi:hypothetical protein